MKLELKDNKVFFENKGHKKEIHPFWLRERVNGENFVDKSTQQRLFDPTQLPENIQIKDLSLNSNFLESCSFLYLAAASASWLRYMVCQSDGRSLSR